MAKPQEDPDSIRLVNALGELRLDPESLPWPERRALAHALAKAMEAEGVSETHLALLHVLAEDGKWEVRKEVADALLLVSEDDFPQLAAKLSGDPNTFVRRAAERALDRRRRGRREVERRRRGLDAVQDEFAALEKAHGPTVAAKARRLAEQIYDRLVGGTVHEMRGILTSVKPAAGRLLHLLDSGNFDAAGFKRQLERIQVGLDRLDLFLDDARAYSQATPTERRREQLTDVVAEAHEMVKEFFAAVGLDYAGVTVDVLIPAEITVDMSRHHIVMAICNIVKNAYEAFATAADNLGKGRVEVRARPVDEEAVEIVVRDNGMGMSAEELDEVLRFIPGGTSKKRHGTGFGLPNARRRVLDHGGSLAIASEEDKGTTVTITLPIEVPESEVQ